MSDDRDKDKEELYGSDLVSNDTLKGLRTAKLLKERLGDPDYRKPDGELDIVKLIFGKDIYEISEKDN